MKLQVDAFARLGSHDDAIKADLPLLDKEVHVNQFTLGSAPMCLDKETAQAEVTNVGHVTEAVPFPIDPDVLGGGEAHRSSPAENCGSRQAHEESGSLRGRGRSLWKRAAGLEAGKACRREGIEKIRYFPQPGQVENPR